MNNLSMRTRVHLVQELVLILTKHLPRGGVARNAHTVLPG